ncbi:MAG: zinc metalloprotease [Saprospiraceae bacterium]|nr:MAG: zinc metalloprotease [Saprospiraceae bacterium]
MYCIVAPEMVNNILDSGTPRQKRWAERMKKKAERIRERREQKEMREEERKKRKEEKEKRREERQRRGTLDQLNRKVIDARNPARNRMEGGNTSEDEDVNSAYDFAGIIHEFFLKEFNRKSIDDAGMDLVATVHYREDDEEFYNAFWDEKETSLKYGEGDGSIFKSFARDLTIAAHEHVHGVIHYSGGLLYENQSGALNESICDVFASMILQYRNQEEARKASWVIGENILGKVVKGSTGVGLRSLRAPGTAYNHKRIGRDLQPAHMDGFIKTKEDFGGVHLNSGIPNHAFFLIANALGGNSWENAGKIWYNSLMTADDSLKTFKEWAGITIDQANKLPRNIRDTAVFSTEHAWKLVGVL